jgi:methyltransferase family protein
VLAALGDARTVLNVGAGAGSYEPADRDVVAVEPSRSMREQRPPQLGVAVDAVAEDLPFSDDSFDAAMALVTVHQWSDWKAGLRELDRVSRRTVVVMSFDGEALDRLWLAEYVPELIAAERGRYPAMDAISAQLSGEVTVEEVPIPLDCVDGFTEAFYGRPESFLDPEVRRAQSAWGFVDRAAARRGLERLRRDLDSGAWDERHGHLRTRPEFVGALRLIAARRSG